MIGAPTSILRHLRWVGAILLLLLLASVLAWAFDTWMSGDLVVRNTELGGKAVGGMKASELAPVIGAAAQRLETTPIEVVTPNGTLNTSAGEISLVVDQQATLKKTLTLGSQASWWKQPLEWVASFFDPREAAVVANVNEEKLTEVVAQRDPTSRIEPIEPTITVDGNGGLKAVNGGNGQGLDPRSVRDILLDAAAKATPPLRAKMTKAVLPPRFSIKEAEALALHATAVLQDPIKVKIGDQTATLAPEMLRRWARATASDAGLVLDFDLAKMTSDLKELLPDAGERPTDASFKVVGGSPIILPGKNGTACCSSQAPQHLVQALQTTSGEQRLQQPVTLPLGVAEPERSVEDARSMGINELVGTFTTNHPANQPRVTNIHRIADLVQGTVIAAGKRLSINDLVGKRTTDKGFVPAGVIYEGAFTDDIGGGVSQFATTLFNAAFFAGLDIPEYQSHSIWLSRYPRGREATLSYPKPDLVIENNTEHAVLIWSTYNETSITVSLYSTRTVVAEQTGQTEAPHGACTRVVTERTRRWLADDRTKVDRFRATYRPEEKVPC